eukprot:CAMPEP_0172325044 /NCGR_PEP_ID=MMETSP1058-20130122/52976_1 /TAXON_ID=83371 /ORGANISM="Detonula confervacea, Strain CCMP 353" /LENGTH=280 /DNA_ID=CAMNT_0013041489 /DNA_START=38 /DNA_END=877 /DNA_ORIENTATION=-
MATIPRKNDVLFGKGTAINTHHGNQRFRSMVEVHKPKFCQSKKMEKRKIGMSIINEFYKLGGSFLMEDPNSRRETNKEGGGNAMNRGTGVNNTIQANPANVDDLVVDPLILKKVWVCVERDVAIKKVMHRLRENKVNVSQKHQLAEREKLVLHPPDTKSSEKNLVVPTKVDVADETRRVTQLEYAKAGSRIEKEETKVESSSQQNHTVKSLAEYPIPVSTQSALQPAVKHSISMMESLPSALAPTIHAPVPVSIQYWIRSAVGLSLSSDDYLKGAVNLSW